VETTRCGVRHNLARYRVPHACNVQCVEQHAACLQGREESSTHLACLQEWGVAGWDKAAAQHGTAGKPQLPLSPTVSVDPPPCGPLRLPPPWSARC
jgi:hypothetical protein